MRLSPQQQTEVRAAVQAHFGRGARIWLFGSRADDSARGGDIDLYIETPKESGIVDAKLATLRDLRERFGDRRIDLVVRPFNSPPLAFHELARSQGVPL
jgi:predicted nucleotidyltransferase